MSAFQMVEHVPDPVATEFAVAGDTGASIKGVVAWPSANHALNAVNFPSSQALEVPAGHLTAIESTASTRSICEVIFIEDYSMME